MKRSESICPRDYWQRCHNCQNWIKAGSLVVTTVMPGSVVIAHSLCPMPVHTRDSATCQCDQCASLRRAFNTAQHQAEIDARVDRHGQRIARRQARERRGYDEPRSDWRERGGAHA